MQNHPSDGSNPFKRIIVKHADAAEKMTNLRETHHNGNVIFLTWWLYIMIAAADDNAM
jgi:hypothetical protein